MNNKGVHIETKETVTRMDNGKTIERPLWVKGTSQEDCFKKIAALNKDCQRGNNKHEYRIINPDIKDQFNTWLSGISPEHIKIKDPFEQIDNNKGISNFSIDKSMGMDF